MCCNKDNIFLCSLVKARDTIYCYQQAMHNNIRTWHQRIEQQYNVNLELISLLFYVFILWKNKRQEKKIRLRILVFYSACFSCKMNATAEGPHIPSYHARAPQARNVTDLSSVFAVFPCPTPPVSGRFHSGENGVLIRSQAKPNPKEKNNKSRKQQRPTTGLSRYVWCGLTHKLFTPCSSEL